MDRDDVYELVESVNISSAKEVIVEAYMEHRYEEGWEVSGLFQGVRVYQDGELKGDIVLDSSGDYGMFSYVANFRHKTNMEFVIAYANYIADSILNRYAYLYPKLRKRVVSCKHIFYIQVPADFEADFPKENEQTQHLRNMLAFDVRLYELMAKQHVNPNEDIRQEKEKLDREHALYMEKYYEMHEKKEDE